MLVYTTFPEGSQTCLRVLGDSLSVMRFEHALGFAWSHTPNSYVQHYCGTFSPTEEGRKDLAHRIDVLLAMGGQEISKAKSDAIYRNHLLVLDAEAILAS